MNRREADLGYSTPALSAPTVSIGLPVYNGAAYLAETIESILAQTYADFELILCDNASTDGTEEICRDYAARDPRIRYHRQPRNIGACGNYDMAFHMGRGRYFKWAAHDDLLAPTFLEKLVPVLEADSGCVLVHAKTVLIDAAGRETGDYVDEITCDSESPAERLERWLCPSKVLCNPVFGLMRRDAMARTPLHGDYIASDRVFLAAMTLQGRCRSIPERLFLRRLHSGRSTAAHPDKRDLTEWFRGTRPRLPVLPIWRLFFGYLNAIHSTSLPIGERLRCYRVMTKWMREKRKGMVIELTYPFRAAFR
jgi:glycosyltransferase involved in cell wall biosynthesis